MNLKETFLSGDRVYDGKLLKVHRDVVAMSGGREEIREVIRHPGAAVIVPQLDDGRFVLVRQFRYALGEEILEFPAGKLDQGEDPLPCAQRELREETGYQAGEWELLLKTHPLPGYSDELHYIYHARNLIPGASHPDPDERVCVETVSAEDLFSLVEKGGITDGKTIIASLYVQCFS